MQELRLAGAISIVDRNPALAIEDEIRRQLLGQRFAGYDDTRCLGAPEIDKVCLTAACRPVKRQGSEGPIGPPVDPADRRGVAVRDQEIGAAEPCAAREVESELHG